MEEQKKQCSCGRSLDGFCDGSHKLTNEQYQKKLHEQTLKESKQHFLIEDTRD